MKRVTPDAKQTLSCPVCEMLVKEADLWRCYRGIKYHFCSQQCVDRFIALPGLYCGDPKHGKSDKQRGQKEIKSRRIVLSSPISDEDLSIISKKLKDMMGIDALEVTPNEIRVRYDLLVVSLKEIESLINNYLVDFKSPLTDKIRRVWIRYTEECELDNRSHPQKHGGCH